MTGRLSRRFILAGGAAATSLAVAAPFVRARGQTKPRVTGVTWGGPWVEAWKQIAAKQKRADLDWILHEAATTAIVAKIKASWPNPPADFVNASEPTLYAMAREDWLEPVSEAAIPNLKYLQSAPFIKNPAGQPVTVPTNLSYVFWAYVEPAAGMPIGKPEDLLSPKLRGKVMLNLPTIASGAQLFSLAMARGGNEHSIEPGFDFVKEIVKAGNVGRVVKTDIDVVNAFTTGEVAVGLINQANYHEIAKHLPLKALGKVPGSPTFKTFIGSEGVAILKRAGDRKPVMDFIDFAIAADNNTAYAAAIGTLPTNEQSIASAELDPLRLHDAAERQKFGYVPDRPYISSQTDAWNRKWELEIGPLL